MKLSHLHSVTTSTFGLLFLGTPHEGIEKAKWYLLSKGVKGILRQHSQLVASMEKNTETLQSITEQFTPLLKQFYIHNFWELRETVHGFRMSCLALGQVDESERLISHVLDARKRILGEEHPYTLWSMNDLSKVYCAQSYPKDALELLIPTLDVAVRTLGRSHIGTLMNMSNLVHTHRMIGTPSNIRTAEAMLGDLISAQIKSLGPSHPDVYGAKLQLAQMYERKGQLSQAEIVYRDILSAEGESPGPRIHTSLKVKESLSEIYHMLGRLEAMPQVEAKL
ncbi:hypothetical protein BDV35DRAFT_404335 [Aspergillus flavus]|uniref:Kinesin light chain n=2 Tax=Aspergillus subgen. Circumdati TaxID=2720871 RepID=A0A5N6HFG3_ASPFL|nr:kinesin light chain, putative [Aspergillus oryzae 3.042]KAB8252647.1 hypothetical protein BDV35DRAFT_404335 [Aspergillus flavus]KDE86120.1 kinesin light chain, putative [Aspergillus oryzae 100-8]|eukprot:EIT75497.1 kinesin light chain, putative [Aspergillus oryzae 3.042]